MQGSNSDSTPLYFYGAEGFAEFFMGCSGCSGDAWVSKRIGIYDPDGTAPQPGRSDRGRDDFDRNHRNDSFCDFGYSGKNRCEGGGTVDEAQVSKDQIVSVWNGYVFGIAFSLADCCDGRAFRDWISHPGGSNRTVPSYADK